ncbi:Chaperone required for the assembly of the mitochondrial F1-ATPase [Candidatus Rhodobacter oscarellae]|uniref:Chaperone required for the assembly of the mitochondrial F1-ATPase n=1 Tax=Candidatus Rhodobacter oscarellae TaxID=1675527 RepID=A0A0J9E5U2_9RHOB|nr:ATP12 family protein [Candidatus Rhodobacter lobularis]KMW58036.1 Chaperone required for the assembly of the mitochondrial F1-ATPase [Candidatus Rhodobacter lobularis]
MSWAAKRFWDTARAVESEGGYAVHLDARPVKTPAKAGLILPTRGLAEAIAAEWDAQNGQVDPKVMPLTRAANAAIDKVSVQFAEVVALLAAYGDSDLTCYRAADPAPLAERQAAAWDPLIDWADQAHGGRLIPVQGVIHQPQNPAALEALAAPLWAMSAFEVTALHDLISLSGSLIIGLAASAEHQPVAALWAASRIDEEWQIEQWGADDEATLEADKKARAFADAARFLALTRGKNPPV